MFQIYQLPQDVTQLIKCLCNLTFGFSAPFFHHSQEQESKSLHHRYTVGAHLTKGNTKLESTAKSFRLTNVAVVHSLRPLRIKIDPPAPPCQTMPRPGYYHYPSHEAGPKYEAAQKKVVSGLEEMTTAMFHMGAEHVEFHNNFNKAQKRIQDMKKAYAPKELDAEVIRSKALEDYLSATNIPSVTALGHYEVEKALDKFQKQEKNLDESQKKTAELVDSLLEDSNSKKGDGHGVKTESADEVGKDAK